MFPTEQQFVTTAHAQIEILAHDTASAPEALLTIQTAARCVNARAIGRAVHLCQQQLAAANDHNYASYQRALTSLRTVIKLYTDGLCEIDPTFKEKFYGNAPTPISAPEPQTNPITAHKAEPRISNDFDPVLLQAANQNAKDVLAPLLKLVKSDTQKSAFEILLSFPNAKESSVHQKTRAQLTPDQPVPLNKTVNFENIMRKVTNQVLREARQVAKTVSISYGAEFDKIDASVALQMREILETYCAEIVRSGVHCEGDMVTNLQRNWQIAVSGKIRTGKNGGQTLDIVLSWPGQSLSQTPQTQKAHAELITLGGTMNRKTAIGRDRDVINGIDTGLDRQSLTLTFPASISKVQKQPATKLAG